MEIERRIKAPDGCEIAKVELVDGVAVVTFKEKDRFIPKSWEDFCRTFPIKEKECYINEDGYIYDRLKGDDRELVADKNTLPDRPTAEAVLALCQLIQLRNCYNGNWVPDWTSQEPKFMIYFSDHWNLNTFHSSSLSDLLFFKNEELCDEFLRNFHQLIDKLKPLYGIKEGGE